MISWLAEVFRIRSDDRRLKVWRDQRRCDEFWARESLLTCRRYSTSWHRIKLARKRLAA